MGKRWTWVAWCLLAVFAVSLVALGALSVANDSFHQVPLADTLALLLAFTAFMVVGALIVAHRPGNAIGWLFSASALLAVTGALVAEYAVYAYLTQPGSLPGAIMAAWYASWTWFPTVLLAFLFPLLLFPTGRLLSPRWRPAAWLAGAAAAAVSVLGALQPSLGVDGQVVANPIGVAGLEDPEASTLGTALLNLVLLLVVVAFVSLVIRFRRSRGEERQQLKLFTYAGALVPLVVALGDVLPVAFSNLVFAAVIAFLPVAAGIAILRYRLYEIDRLINRTLVYGLLTVLLGGVYAAVVLVLGQLFGGIGAEPPSWAVAGATLTVAALFQPARRRLQELVDRRFNRRKYNAARTVEAFASRLRDELDLDTLSAELVAVVDQTMQPSQASLWLRPPIERVQRIEV